MYAIIKTGGRQYKVSQGDIIEVEKADKASGELIEVNDVLLVSDGERIEIGKPTLDSSKVVCEVLSHKKGKKTIAFTFRRRKGSKTKKGHRQLYTKLRVKEIVV